MMRQCCLGKETEQEALPVHDNPVLHSSEVNSRVGEVSYLCHRFLVRGRTLGACTASADQHVPVLHLSQVHTNWAWPGTE